MEHWFLDSEYSTEFEEFLDKMNRMLKSDINAVDFDKLVNENKDTIFYDEEKHIWRERLLVSAYLKMLDKSTAKQSFSIIFILMKNISMSSI